MARTSTDAGWWLLREDHRGHGMKRESEISRRLKGACRYKVPLEKGPLHERTLSAGLVYSRCSGEKKRGKTFQR